MPCTPPARDPLCCECRGRCAEHPTHAAPATHTQDLPPRLQGTNRAKCGSLTNGLSSIGAQRGTQAGNAPTASLHCKCALDSVCFSRSCNCTCSCVVRTYTTNVPCSMLHLLTPHLQLCSETHTRQPAPACAVLCRPSSPAAVYTRLNFSGGKPTSLLARPRPSIAGR